MQENEPSVPETAQPQAAQAQGVGLGGKAVAAAAGLAAGTAGMVASVDHALRSNIRQALKPAVDEFRKIRDVSKWNWIKKSVLRRDYAPQGVIAGKLDEQAVRMAYDMVHVKICGTDHQFDQAQSIFKKGTAEARAGAEAVKDVYSLSYEKSLLKRAKDLVEPAEKALEARGARAQKMAQNSVIATAADSAEKIVRDGVRRTVAHMPLSKKLALSSELHLTGGQKAWAGIAFAAGAIVTAGAIHWSLSPLGSNASKMQQENGALRQR